MLLGLAGVCCAPVQPPTFLEQKTGIALGERPECGSGFTGNEVCPPERFGGVEWRKSANLPPYTVSDRAIREGYDSVIAEVRAHYLGSPFYGGDVHAICKSGVSARALPREGTSLQDYNLAAMIEDRAVRSVATELKATLDDKQVPGSFDIARRFQARLTGEVRMRVRARLLWFVVRYPGGFADLSRNEQLKPCVDEQQKAKGWLVTGIAGYIVLNNHVDTAIDSPATFSNALEGALEGHADVKLEPELVASLADSWRDRVAGVALITAVRRDLSSVAWPLWIQFE